MTNRSTRLTFNLSEELADALREMADRSGSSMTDVLKRAIEVQRYLEKQQDAGNNLLLEDPERNTLRELVLFKH